MCSNEFIISDRELKLVFPQSLSKASLTTLNGENWVGEEAMNKLLELICQYSDMQSVRYLDTAFYKVLSKETETTSDKYQKLKRWVDKTNISECDWLFIPMLVDNGELQIDTYSKLQ